jgi:Cdc6-like AAA superfamily ATPase
VTKGVRDWQTRAVFVVVVTGPPGSGKTVTLAALSDALVRDGVAHAAVDVDEVAWAYPYPDLAQRCEQLHVWCAAHRSAGYETLLVAEVAELGGVHAVVDTENSTCSRVVDQIRSARSDVLL